MTRWEPQELGGVSDTLRHMLSDMDAKGSNLLFMTFALTLSLDKELFPMHDANFMRRPTVLLKRKLRGGLD